MSPFPANTTAGLAWIGQAGISGLYYCSLVNTDYRFVRFNMPPAGNWVTLGTERPAIPPSGSAPMDVKFRTAGLSAGVYYGRIQLTSSHPKLIQSVPVEVTIIGAPDISIDMEVDTLRHPIYVGATSSFEPIIIRNLGTSNLLVTSITSDNPDFYVYEGPSLLHSGERGKLWIYFDAHTAGYQRATITVNSDDPDEPTVTFDLVAKAVPPPIPQFSVTSLSAELFTGARYETFIELKNIGGSDLEYDIWSTNLTLQIEPAYNILPAGETDLIRVTFDASFTDDGVYDDQIVLGFNGDLGPTIDTHLTVHGASQVTANPPFIENTFINYVTDATVLVRNDGVRDLEVTSISIDNAVFDIDATPFVIGPGSEQPVAISFHPINSGSYSANATITSNDPDEGVLVVPISAIAEQVPAIQLEQDTLFIDFETDVPQTVSVTIRNLGEGTLRWNAPPNYLLNWIVPLQASGEIHGLGDHQLQLRVQNDGLRTYTYIDSLHIYSNDPLRPSTRLVVVLHATNSQPELTLPATMFNLTVALPKIVRLPIPFKNTGLADLNWSIQSNGTLATGLTIDKVGGTLSAFDSDTIWATLNGQLYQNNGVNTHYFYMYSNDQLVYMATLGITVTRYPNAIPLLISPLTVHTVLIGDPPMHYPLTTKFRDPDNDPLSYEVSVESPSLASVDLNGGELLITGLLRGRTDVTITAKDPWDAMVTGKITIRVVDEITALEDTRQNVSMSPNPFSSRTTLRYEALEPGEAAVLLTDLQGRVVWRSGSMQEVSGTNEHSIEPPGLSAGLYLIRLTRNGELFWVGKLLKQ